MRRVDIVIVVLQIKGDPRELLHSVDSSILGDNSDVKSVTTVTAEVCEDVVLTSSRAAVKVLIGPKSITPALAGESGDVVWITSPENVGWHTDQPGFDREKRLVVVLVENRETVPGNKKFGKDGKVGNEAERPIPSPLLLTGVIRRQRAVAPNLGKVERLADKLLVELNERLS